MKSGPKVVENECAGAYNLTAGLLYNKIKIFKIYGFYLQRK